MRSLVLIAVLAALSLPTLALAEESCAKKCNLELRACDAANCAPGRKACVAKCADPKNIDCRLSCIREFQPCGQPCNDAQDKCLLACNQK